MPVFTNTTTCQNGTRWNFTELLSKKISPWNVLSWSSSVEKADDYARLFYNHSEIFEEDSFLCNCTEGYFGKQCEYALLSHSSLFSKDLENLFELHIDPQGHQDWGKILCYETLECNYGMLCLDWRNICDGQQNCMNGIDEENCDLLEFNECKENEYRCLDGMCIGEEYWLDGLIDCMDQSDEKYSIGVEECVIESMVIFCDDRKCPGTSLWSCGDGQCIQHFQRYIYQTEFPQVKNCFNMREFNHMCELAATHSLWTKSDGLCAQPGYNDSSLQLSSNRSSCLYLIRCAFSNGAEFNCPCNGINCNEQMERVCGPSDVYRYPKQGIIRPWLLQNYLWKEIGNDKTPINYPFIGSFRCRGFAAVFEFEVAITFPRFYYIYSVLEKLICMVTPRQYQNVTSIYQYSPICWNNSFTFNGRPYAFFDICPELKYCFSKYRIGDGDTDCLNNEDENEIMLQNMSYCQNIQKHRFQCSSEQRTCLSISSLNFLPQQQGYCTNKYDIIINGHGRYITDVLCAMDRDFNECALIRYYIGNSSIANPTFIDNNEKNINLMQLFTKIPFAFHCDTVWHQQSPYMDENHDYCQVWICRKDQFRCRTGQCISIDWVCDGEWDCSDASDEFGLPDEWNDHNEHLADDLIERKKMCHENDLRLPFRDLCNFTDEYPCYRALVPDPLNISAYRPCINIGQIGDGIVDCYGGLDEKNTLNDSKGNILGNTLCCEEGCVDSGRRCQKDTECTTTVLCSHKSKNSSWCSGNQDVVCLNGTCAENAHCDGKYQCLHGEDEHLCLISQSSEHDFIYRSSKYYNRRNRIQILLTKFPKENTQSTRKARNVMMFEQIPQKFAYMCNRGFPFYIPSKDTFRCACPPTYYGSVCQYFSDRISIITHLDLSTFPTTFQVNLLTIVIYLFFENIVIDHHIFHINPSLEIKNPIRHRFYLLYSRSDDFLQHKRKRYFNRTDILNHHPYSVHFDIFSLTNNQTIELGSFHHPIYFDFLPAFRLATALKFPPWFNNIILDPCANHTCNANSTCKPILNQNHSFYCSCKWGYSGTNCEDYDGECSTYCNSKSICRPKFRGLIGNSSNPLCICPLGHFGPRCYLKNEACKSNPCEHNSICYASYDPSGEKPVICICSESFFGDRCELEKSKIQIRINTTIAATVSNVQMYRLSLGPYAFVLHHQQVIRGLPKIVQYKYGEEKLPPPPIGILKIYQELFTPRYFMLYMQIFNQSSNFTTTPEECPYALDLLSRNQTNPIPEIFRYHQICKNDPNRICFYDSNYFCWCVESSRAECSVHDTQIDHCDKCLEGGHCVGDKSEQSSNFICMCLHCTQGSRCEFSLQPFGFTFDSLLIFDTHIVQYIYISMTTIIFLLGLFNNYCSFVTFKRKQPRLVGVGNYLLFVTILNQCSLFVLLLKFITILLGTMGITSDVSCKIISYLLSVSTRSTYWLTSWVTVNRLLTVLYPTSLKIKSPRFAIYFSLGTLLVLLLMHIHEILFYQTIQQLNSSISVCVTNFHYPMVKVYNRASTLIHYVLPFSIQIICITLLLVCTTRSRARATIAQTTFKQVFKKQLSSQKELFITPIIIIFSVLPQTILSFSLACSQLSNWQRRTLLVTILLTYVPQILGFILYVLPSSTYKKEFGGTYIAKKMFKWMFKTAAKT